MLVLFVVSPGLFRGERRLSVSANQVHTSAQDLGLLLGFVGVNRPLDVEARCSGRATLELFDTDTPGTAALFAAFAAFGVALVPHSARRNERRTSFGRNENVPEPL